MRGQKSPHGRPQGDQPFPLQLVLPPAHLIVRLAAYPPEPICTTPRLTGWPGEAENSPLWSMSDDPAPLEAATEIRYEPDTAFEAMTTPSSVVPPPRLLTRSSQRALSGFAGV